MHKLLVIQRLHPEVMAMLESHPDLTVNVIEDSSEAAVMTAIADAQAVTLRSTVLTEKMLAAASDLRVIARHGVGYDNIPLDYCTKRAIPVVVTGPVNAVAVAEHSMYLLLAAARHAIVQDRAVRSGHFAIRQQLQVFELQGKTMLIAGFGHIGTEVARRALAFGLRIVVYDPFYRPRKDIPVTLAESLEAGLEKADIVSLHMPLTTATYHLIDARRLALLPDKAIIINASRGGLVDEEALARAVASGRLFAAGLDTFEQEPPSPSSALLRLPTVVLSPHSAPLTSETFMAMGMKTAENVLAGLQGRLDPALVINKEVLHYDEKNK